MKTLLSTFFCLVGFIAQAQHYKVSRIPFRLTDFNNILVPVVINEKDTLELMLHTGSDYITVIEDSFKKMKTLTVTDTITGVVSWGGSEDLRWSKGNSVALGELQYRGIPVFIDEKSGHESDGKIGLKFFEGKYLEINFDENMLSIYDEAPLQLEQYSKCSSRYVNSTLYVDGFPVIGSSAISTSFMLHTGYSGAVLFSDAFAKEHDLLHRFPVTGESRMSDAAGNTIYTRKSVMPTFNFGNEQLKEVPVAFFDSTVKIQNISIVGGDVIKRFNLILNPALDAVYFSRSRHFNAAYFDI